MPLDLIRLISHDRLYRIGVVDLDERQRLVECLVDGNVSVVKDYPCGEKLAISCVPQWTLAMALDLFPKETP